MKKNRIPERNRDLKRYARLKNMKYPLFFLLYAALFCGGFLYFVLNRYDGAEPLRPWVYPVFFGVVLVSGWFVSLMNRFVGDRSLRGRIEGSRYLRNFDRGLSRKGGFSLDDHTYLRAKVILPNGKRKALRIPLFEDGYDGYYREGDEIVNFRGLNYPLCLRAEEEGAHLCTVCGVRTYYQEGRTIHGEAQPELRDGLLVCRSCKHTLINIHDLEG